MYTLLAGDSDQLETKTFEIVDLLKQGENVTSLWIPGAGRTRFGLALQEDPRHFVPGENFSRFIFIYLDISLDAPFLERQVVETLGNYSDANGIKNKIKDIVADGKEIVLILDNFSYQNPALANYVISLKTTALENIHVLAMMTHSSFAQAQLDVKSYPNLPYLFHNIVEMPLLPRGSALAWLQRLAQEFKLEVEAGDLELMVDYCGGISRLLKNYIRGFKRYPGHEAVVQSPEFNFIVQYLWQEFSETEQAVIRTAFLTSHIVDENTGRYLVAAGLLTPEGKVFGRWPELVVKGRDGLQLTLSAGKLIWQDVDLSTVLTGQEHELLKLLLEKNGKVVTRDEVATVMWGERTPDKYSDWAIDKQISRLRKKLETLGISSESIVTLKRRGFKFQISHT